MKKQSIKISVIVPVYNVAPYLARCLDSLVFQTLGDIEIICIDDKSTDNSLEILKEYAKKDPRVKVIAQKYNMGVSAARNAGINVARGEYLGFVDSDDYVDRDFFEKIYKSAMHNNADIARGGVKVTSYDGATITDTSEIKNIEKRGKWYFSWQWWTAIYRTNMVKGAEISFDEDIISGEDTIFLVRCLSVSGALSITPDTYYHYIRRTGSLDEQIMSAAKIESRIKALRTVSQIYNSANMSAADYIDRYAWAMGGMYTHFFKNTSESSRQSVANALVQMYRDCIMPGGIAKELSAIMAPQAAAYLKSYDIKGLLSHIGKTAQKAGGVIQKDTFYLFGAIPMCEIRRTAELFILRFCGINILKIKSAERDFRIWVLYIPIVRRKRRFNG